MTDDNVQVETPETQDPLVPETEGSETPDEGTEDAQQNTEQEGAAEKKSEEPEYSERVQKRIAKEVWKAKQAERRTAELEQRLAELESKISAPPKVEKPSPDNFDSHDEYIEALTDWKLDQRQSESEKKKQEAEKADLQKQKLEEGRKSWEAKEATFAEKNADYHDVVAEFADLIPRNENSAHITHQILNHDNGPEILYQLAKDHELAAEIYSRPYTFAAQKLNQITATKAKPNPLPNPPTPLKGASSAAGKDPSRMSTEQYMEWRAAQKRNRK